MPTVDEHELIARFFRPLAGRNGTFDLTDDAASLTPPPGRDLVVTKDGIAEGFHFLPGESAANVARKALRVNLSDLAAKGAEPLCYLMMLGLAEAWEEEWLGEFTTALAEDQKLYGIELLGGDTIRAPGLVVSITAIGTVPAGRMIRRHGARAGDHVYVTGTIGDAALGLLAVREDERLADLPPEAAAHLEDRYRLPRPRSVIVRALLAHASAALDVSDGLAGDLDKLCATSGVSACVDLEAVPLSEAAAAALAADPALLELCVTGGDDYEILCAVPEEEAAGFETAARAACVAVTRIGQFVEGGGQAEFRRGGAASGFARRAFSHTG